MDTTGDKERARRKISFEDIPDIVEICVVRPLLIFAAIKILFSRKI